MVAWGGRCERIEMTASGICERSTLASDLSTKCGSECGVGFERQVILRIPPAIVSFELFLWQSGSEGGCGCQSRRAAARVRFEWTLMESSTEGDYGRRVRMEADGVGNEGRLRTSGSDGS